MSNPRNTIHGLHGLPENAIWRGINYRCNNPRSPLYKNYGARGIAVCQEWANSFVAFYSDMGPRPTAGHSVDRIDNDGPYAPWNCRWATRTQQQRNRRPCRAVVRSDGATFSTIAEAAEAHRVTRSAIRGVCVGSRKTAAGFGWSYAQECVQ